MQSIRVSDHIIPVSEFKTHAAEWLRKLSNSTDPLVITQNGKAAAVLLSPSAFDQLNQHSHFMLRLEEGLADAEAGRTHSHSSILAELRDRFDRADTK